ncbi:MAG: hypothetical protein BECKG1743D_GA0114223_104463 [Candidatus Kentron sp. G]|nr:MAG: hypothetical protein BECKG1743D_GA0114223_104463 [Candidatus Kentron sp. G]
MTFAYSSLFVVLGVGFQPLDQHNAISVAYLHHQTIVVSLDIENDPVAGKKVHVSVSVLDILGRFPNGVFYLVEPHLQRILGLCVPAPELSL